MGRERVEMKNCFFRCWRSGIGVCIAHTQNQYAYTYKIYVRFRSVFVLFIIIFYSMRITTHTRN